MNKRQGTMAKPVSAFASIKALRNVAANQLEVDPGRACTMALQACDQIIALCADHDVAIPTERPVVWARRIVTRRPPRTTPCIRG